MESISKAYQVRLDKLQQQNRESEAKSQESLRRLRLLVEQLKSLSLAD